MGNEAGKEPLISVIMTVFNAQSTVRQAVESVLRQTYSNIEFIIVDDASTDETVKVIKSIEDDRIRFFSVDKNRHAAVAANFGLEFIRGDYVAKIDADDYWDPKKLEVQLAYMQTHPECGAYFTRVHLVGEKGDNIENLHPELYKLFCLSFDSRKEWMRFFVHEGNCLIHPSVMLRSSVIRQVGFHDIFFLQALDYEWWMRFLLKSEIQVCQEKLTYYRWDNNPEVKISSEGEKSNTRFFNEKVMAVLKLFKSMTEEEFRYFFADCFRDRNARGELAIACEKAFYMMDYLKDKGPYVLWAVQSLAEIYKQEEGRRLLEETYSYNIKDGYQLYTQHFFLDPLMERKIEDLEKAEREKDYRLAQLTLERDNLLAENVREHTLAYEAGLRSESLQNQLDHRKALEKGLKEENEALLRRVEILTQEQRRISGELQESQGLLYQMQNSLSWKLTKPLRMMKGILKRKR